MVCGRKRENVGEIGKKLKLEYVSVSELCVSERIVFREKRKVMDGGRKKMDYLKRDVEGKDLGSVEWRSWWKDELECDEVGVRE